MRFPANLEAFFASKEGLKVQSQESDPKATAEKGSDEKETLQPSISNPGDEAEDPPLRSASPCTSCPLCSKSFPLEVMVNCVLRLICWVQLEIQELEEHAARCCGTEDEKTTANCPICDLELQVSEVMPCRRGTPNGFSEQFNVCHFRWRRWSSMQLLARQQRLAVDCDC